MLENKGGTHQGGMEVGRRLTPPADSCRSFRDSSTQTGTGPDVGISALTEGIRVVASTATIIHYK